MMSLKVGLGPNTALDYNYQHPSICITQLQPLYSASLVPMYYTEGMEAQINPAQLIKATTTTTTTTFVCSLNPISQTSIPRPYTIISSLSFHHCSSQPSQYPSVSSRAYTCLLNESIEKQRLSPERRRSQSGTCFVCPGPALSEFRIKRKEGDWLVCNEAELSREFKSKLKNHFLSCEFRFYLYLFTVHVHACRDRNRKR